MYAACLSFGVYLCLGNRTSFKGGAYEPSSVHKSSAFAFILGYVCTQLKLQSPLNEGISPVTPHGNHKLTQAARLHQAYTVSLLYVVRVSTPYILTRDR